MQRVDEAGKVAGVDRGVQREGGVHCKLLIRRQVVQHLGAAAPLVVRGVAPVVELARIEALGAAALGVVGGADVKAGVLAAEMLELLGCAAWVCVVRAARERVGGTTARTLIGYTRPVATLRATHEEGARGAHTLQQGRVSHLCICAPRRRHARHAAAAEEQQPEEPHGTPGARSAGHGEARQARSKKN